MAIDGKTMGLALSGGGYRATLFGLGSLWRLNDAGLLGRLDRITGVSGGGTASASVTALSQGLYQPVDPFYGLPIYTSTNLNTFAEAGGSNKVVAVVAYRPNIHVRVRHDVRVSRSNEASVGGTSLWQNDLTGFRYVWRGGLYVHDLDRAVVAITNGS